MVVDFPNFRDYSWDMKLTTQQAVRAFRKLPQSQKDVIWKGAELLSAKTGLPMDKCIHTIAECCVARLLATNGEAVGYHSQ